MKWDVHGGGTPVFVPKKIEIYIQIVELILKNNNNALNLYRAFQGTQRHLKMSFLYVKCSSVSGNAVMVVSTYNK